MRIGLNLLHALPEIGGGWNYIQRLVAALGEYDRSSKYVVFVTRFSDCLVPHQPNFRKVLVAIDSRSRPLRILHENTVLQFLALHHRVGCMHWFASTQAVLNTVPGLVTVFDLQPFRDLSLDSRGKKLYLQTMMRQTVRRAKVLLPMSEATASDLCEMLQARRDRMMVIPPIVDARFRPMGIERIIDFRARYGLPEQFWLYVAHFYPHKNHLALLRAYYDLKRSGVSVWPLVLRGDPKGAESEIRQAVAQLGLESDIIFLPRLDEPELPILYSAASAVVFPSVYEGGGIPVLESMACGCPLLASDIPPVREFAGDSAEYFSPEEASGIAAGMMDFQQNPKERSRRRAMGLTRAAEFRAEPVVQRLLEAYEKAAKH